MPRHAPFVPHGPSRAPPRRLRAPPCVCAELQKGAVVGEFLVVSPLLRLSLGVRRPAIAVSSPRAVSSSRKQRRSTRTLRHFAAPCASRPLGVSNAFAPPRNRPAHHSNGVGSASYAVSLLCPLGASNILVPPCIRPMRRRGALLALATAEDAPHCRLACPAAVCAPTLPSLCPATPSYHPAPPSLGPMGPFYYLHCRLCAPPRPFDPPRRRLRAPPRPEPRMPPLMPPTARAAFACTLEPCAPT
ncbi:hypothetical protein DENSPDRAFT_934162 [Dentipellis sp. KUC8613]|nr:hypothetical protein DENSPDRAFT_934162 [Dentipellis sp. KUC8613]